MRFIPTLTGLDPAGRDFTTEIRSTAGTDPEAVSGAVRMFAAEVLALDAGARTARRGRWQTGKDRAARGATAHER